MSINFKKFTRFFGNEYIKFWYVAFAITIGLMYLDHINNSSINQFKFTQYDNLGNVVKEELITETEIAVKLKTPGHKSFEPVKRLY